MDMLKFKKSVVLLILFLALYGVIKWVDKEGDPCEPTDQITMPFRGEVMSCVNGKWAYSK